MFLDESGDELLKSEFWAINIFIFCIKSVLFDPDFAKTYCSVHSEHFETWKMPPILVKAQVYKARILIN